MTAQRAQWHQHTASNATRTIAPIHTAAIQQAQQRVCLHGRMATWLHGYMAAYKRKPQIQMPLSQVVHCMRQE